MATGQVISAWRLAAEPRHDGVPPVSVRQWRTVAADSTASSAPVQKHPKSWTGARQAVTKHGFRAPGSEVETQTGTRAGTEGARASQMMRGIIARLVAEARQNGR